MTATFYVGDAISVMNKLPEKSVDLVLTSPPFLALRSYLPADHPDKALEGGSQATPGAFIDWLIDVVEACDRVLAPHGSLCIELGDTYAGSGGAGGDYNADGLRDGQPKFRQAGARGGGAGHMEHRKQDDQFYTLQPGGRGWPLPKSLSLIPELFRLTLVYGTNPLTGRQTDRWRLRNVVRWVRPNPPVGALGDKFRPATSELMVFCKSAKRYFDLDAVRAPYAQPERIGKTSNNGRGWEYPPGDSPSPGRPSDVLSHWNSTPGFTRTDKGGAPPLDWWLLPDAEDAFNEVVGGAELKTSARINDEIMAERNSPQLPAGAPPFDWWNIPLLEGEEETRYGPKAPPPKTRGTVKAATADPTVLSSNQSNGPDNPLGAPPLDWWNIPPGGYVTWPERVNPGEYVDGTLYIASVGCPLHEGLSAQAATAPHGEPTDTPSSHSSDTDANPALERQADSVPTDQPSAQTLWDGNSGSPVPVSTPAAKRRSKASNRTAPAPATSPPGTASDRTPDRTDDTSSGPLSDGPHPDSPESRTSAVRQAFLALESYARTGHKPVELEGCSCSFAINPDSTSHYAVKPGKPRNRQAEPAMSRGGNWNTFPNYESSHPGGAPPLDWWEIPPGGYQGSHYAVFPPELCIKPIKAMCPEKVCRQCGEPSRRIVADRSAFDRQPALAAHIKERRRSAGVTLREVNEWFGFTGTMSSHWEDARIQPAIPSPEVWPLLKERLGLSDEFDELVLGERRWTESTVDYLTENGQALALAERRVAYDRGGLPPVDASRVKANRKAPDSFSDCGHDDWRPGLVLDPFGGSGTAALVATGHGRDCILIDLDERNFDLALERVGPFILERAT